MFHVFNLTCRRIKIQESLILPFNFLNFQCSKIKAIRVYLHFQIKIVQLEAIWEVYNKIIRILVNSRKNQVIHKIHFQWVSLNINHLTKDSLILLDQEWYKFLVLILGLINLQMPMDKDFLLN
jgi:hypothetical protein